MSGYKNLDDEIFHPEVPNNQSYDPSEYNTQTYEGNGSYNPADTQTYNSSDYYHPQGTQANSTNDYYNPQDAQAYSTNDYYNPQDAHAYRSNDYYKSQDTQTYNTNNYSNSDTNHTTPNYSEQPYMNTSYGNGFYGNSDYTDTNYGEYDSHNSEYDYSQYGSSYYNNTTNSSPVYRNTEYNNSGYQTQEYNNPNATDFADTEYPESNSSEYSAKQRAIKDSLDVSLYAEDYIDVTESLSDLSSDDDTDEQLTPAEVEDIKRQKAAERRKKLVAKEQRRKQRMKQAIIRCSILLLIIILIVLGIIKLVSAIQEHFEQERKAQELSEFLATSEATTEEPVANIDEAIIAKEIPTDRESAMEQLVIQAESDTEIQGICDNAAALPDVVIRHLAANSELKSFAIKYPAKINTVYDGEFTMDVTEGEFPLYLQYDEEWGYADYANDLVGISGDGPTALSMAYTYLKNDGSMNPIKIADFATEKGYVDSEGNTQWTLMTDGAASLGLISDGLSINKDEMIAAIEAGKVIICQMSSGDFTTTQHYIVIRDFKNGLFYVNDPASAARSEVGWDYKRLSTQIENMCTLVAGSDTSSENVSETEDSQADDSATDDSQSDDSQDGDSATDNSQMDDSQDGDSATDDSQIDDSQAEDAQTDD